MSDARQCWDCGGTEFRLPYDGDELVAVCVECGGSMSPHDLYVPEENSRDHYEIEMTHD